MFFSYSKKAILSDIDSLACFSSRSPAHAFGSSSTEWGVMVYSCSSGRKSLVRSVRREPLKYAREWNHILRELEWVQILPCRGLSTRLQRMTDCGSMKLFPFEGFRKVRVSKQQGQVNERKTHGTLVNQLYFCYGFHRMDAK